MTLAILWGGGRGQANKMICAKRRK